MRNIFLPILFAGFWLAGCSNDKGTDVAVTPSADEQTVLQIERNFRPMVTVPGSPPPTVTVTASSNSVNSSNSGFRTITFAVTITGSDTAWYALTDEYSVDTTFGALGNGTFSLPLQLPDSVGSADTDGRIFTFTANAVSTSLASASTSVAIQYVNNDDDDDDGDDNGGCDNDHDGHGKHKHKWKCERCGKNNHDDSSKDEWKCKKCNWKHDHNWKCDICGKHHPHDSKKDYCKKKNGNDKDKGKGKGKG